VVPNPHQRVQIGDIEGFEAMQSHQTVNHSMRRRPAAQGCLHGLVMVTLAFLGVDDAAVHQIDHGNDLHEVHS